MTKCTRCGEERYPIYFFQTPTSKHTRRMKDATPVCEECLTPGERFRLIELPKINRDLKKQQPETISRQVYERLLLTASEWKCPYHVKDPRDCFGELCSIEEFDRCMETQKAMAELKKVWMGEILVK